MDPEVYTGGEKRVFLVRVSEEVQNTGLSQPQAGRITHWLHQYTEHLL